MRLAIGLAAALLLASSAAVADPPLLNLSSWNVEANGPGRFVAAHGRRSSIMGYPQTGLEVWAYPLQLLSGYQVRFRESGRVQPFEGRQLLSRIETSPAEVVRVYNGPDFVVREHLFVPLDEPAALLTYEVEGRPDIEVEARFEPSLNLMWPGALGGQDVSWSDDRSAYVEREPVHGYSAVIRSPDAIAHDSTVNMATNRPAALSLLMQPRRDPDGVRRARLVVSQDDPDGRDSSAGMEKRGAALLAEADARYASVLGEAVAIATPDRDVNRALESAIVAVDEAWVCTPQIGCGNVAGYGPSRPQRRPQYAWYFAGDGLIAVESLLAAGRYERARDELEFIAKFQNKSNGMIWHEMSTSAPLIDWEKRYPYMFVHVDITLQYLSTLADYVRTTGDTAFLNSHWAGIEAAWRYAYSLIDPRTALPSIPAGKEAQNEQTVLRDDVQLSTAWMEAARAFAGLARTRGDAALAREADRAAEATRLTLRDHYWDESNGFWLGGHTLSGKPVREQRLDAIDVLLQGAFTDAQAARALDRLSTPAFQTDWGVRSVSADDPDYDPNAYASGAVWGLGSSAVSTIFWQEHRPFTAWNAWHGLVPWSSLDSPGHMHEVTAGDLFHPELESVPEQIWSSAGFLSAAVHGLLGIEIDGGSRTVTLAPHLPASWNDIAVERLRVGSSRVDLRMHEDADSITLEIDNPGAPVTFEFNPEVPLGAELKGAQVNGAPVAATPIRTAQDLHASLTISAPSGITHALIRYSGGVRIETVDAVPLAGERSINPKLVSASWNENTLKLQAYARDPDHAAIDLFTPMKIIAAEGVAASIIAGGHYRLQLKLPSAAAAVPDTYAPVTATVKLESVANP